MPEICVTNPCSWNRTNIVIGGGTICAEKTNRGLSVSRTYVLNQGINAKNKDFAASFVSHMPDKPSYLGLSENLDEESLSIIAQDIANCLEQNESPKLILITCGTDAMEQVARYIQKKLGDSIIKKGTKVILTGANRNLSHENTDGWENLEFAFECGHKDDIIPGVYIAFHKKLIPAEFAVKEPFNGIEMNLASIHDIEYEKAKLIHKEKEKKLISDLQADFNNRTFHSLRTIEYPVNVIRSNHNEFLEKVKTKNPEVVLLVLYHSGTANTNKPETSVAKLVKDLREDRNILFFGATENDEPTDLHSYETSHKLRESGVVPLYNMWRSAALVKLGFVTSESRQETIDKMMSNVAGEIDESLIKWEDIRLLKALYK